VNSDGYLFHSENFNLADTASYTEINKDIKLEKIEVGNKVVLNNIFYEFGKATLSDESLSELETMLSLLKNNPTIKIEISSHTDNVGSDEFNLKLSGNRAQAVVDYLTQNGISKEMVVAKGYGKSQPISSNDTEDGRQQNRRTEFKILGK